MRDAMIVGAVRSPVGGRNVVLAAGWPESVPGTTLDSVLLAWPKETGADPDRATILELLA